MLLSAPIREYRLVSLFFSIFPAVVFEGVASLISLTYRHRFESDPDRIPKNAILVAMHGDIFCSVVTLGEISHVLSGGVYLGFHGFQSYIWSMGSRMRGIRSLRFDRIKHTDIMSWIISKLNSGQIMRFFIRTDSGGPYGRVRKSAITMSLATGRPIVVIRQRASRSWVINQHAVPIPFSEIMTSFSIPIESKALSAIPDAEARLKLVQDLV